MRRVIKILRGIEMLDAHRKIAFVAHEFGDFKGNGGIATCLHQLVRAILDCCSNIEVYVISIQYNKEEPLEENTRFHSYHLLADSCGNMGREVLRILKKIRPDYVELAEYLGLGLESLLYREFGGKELEKTVFFTDHHTATREIFEWSTLMPFKLAHPNLRATKEREHAQMIFSDVNMAPSQFLADYDTQNYAVDVIYMPHVVYFECENKHDVQNRVGISVDLTFFENKFIVSCISRFEQRKNQAGLVQAFCDFLSRTGTDAYLILAGNTSRNEITGVDYRRTVFQAIPQKYKDRILMFDFMNKAGKDKIIAITDVAVMASPYENFPVAMTEYVMQGVPIIASKYSGCYDYICASGQAFDPFIEGDLSQRIEDFYNRDVDGWQAIAQQQREAMQEICGVNTAVEEKLALYRQHSLQPSRASHEPPLERIFITEEDMNYPVNSTGLCDIVLTVTNVRDIAVMYADRLARIFTLSDKNMVCLTPEERYDPIVHLVNDGIVLLPKVNLSHVRSGTLWIELLSDIYLEREKYVSFVPINEAVRGGFRVEAWKEFYDRIFYKRYTLNLERQFHHDS